MKIHSCSCFLAISKSLCSFIFHLCFISISSVASTYTPSKHKGTMLIQLNWKIAIFNNISLLIDHIYVYVVQPLIFYNVIQEIQLAKRCTKYYQFLVLCCKFKCVRWYAFGLACALCSLSRNGIYYCDVQTKEEGSLDNLNAFL